jgi:ubiquinol-cytochrome c reductase iron-sulfur subunit
MAALEVDLSKVEMGQTVTVKWRGKPVFVRRRTEAEIDGARAVQLSQLRDPERDEDRAKNPEV